MKINFKKHMQNDSSWLQHLIIEGLSNTDEIESVAKDVEYVKNGDLDIELRVNGIEIDIEKVCEEWQSQVDRMLTEKASKMMEDKFNEIDDVFGAIKTTLAELLKIEIKNKWDY